MKLSTILILVVIFTIVSVNLADAKKDKKPKDKGKKGKPKPKPKPKSKKPAPKKAKVDDDNSSSTSNESESDSSASTSDELFESGENDCKQCQNVELKPVCGTDGTTYKNMCVFRCMKEKKTKVQRNGECESSTEDHDASESDEKGLLGAGVKVGKKKEKRGCECPKGDTVCATDGKTYASKCLMVCHRHDEKTKVHHYGNCDEDTPIAKGDTAAVDVIPG